VRLDVVLAGQARRQGDKTALICGDRRLGYGEVMDSVNRLAQGLAARGLGVDDRIAIYLPNGIEVPLLCYAAFSLGAVVVPVTTRLTVRELAQFCEDSGAKILAYHADQGAALAEFLASRPDLDTIVVGDVAEADKAFEKLLAIPPGPLPPIPLEQDECLINFTSGTTGRPKGAIATHANLMVQHGLINGVEWGLSADDRFLVTTPLAHRTGIARVINAFALGASVVVMPSFDAAATVDVIASQRVTVMGMVPTVCRMLLPEIAKAPEKLASLRLAVVTGEAFPVELKKRFIELLPQTRLVSFFAMTEVGVATSLSHEEQFSHPKSVGRPMPGVEVRIVDDRGHDLAHGEIGELLVRCGRPGAFTVMKGYLDTAANAEALRDGWLHTGDMAYCDEDGYLYIADRKKDMILSGGFNIYSKEVEQVIGECAGVAEAAVVGVPDATYGEAVAAYVEPRPGAALTADEIVAHCRDAIASYKKPKYVVFVDELPRNAIGKVLKRELSARAREELPWNGKQSA
jgi:acyl-CoA synthetase (AMP-forming)/AMP-acid ligase II